MHRAAALLLPLCLLACKKDGGGSSAGPAPVLGDEGPIEPRKLIEAELPSSRGARQVLFTGDGRLLALGRTISIFSIDPTAPAMRELGWFGFAADRDEPPPGLEYGSAEMQDWRRTHETVSDMVITADGTHVVAGSGAALGLWKLGSGGQAEKLAEVRGAHDQLYGLAASPDGRWVLALARPSEAQIGRAGPDRFDHTPEGMLRLWRLEPGSDTPLAARAEVLFEKRPGAAAFTADGAYAIAVGSSRQLVVVSLDGDGGMQVAAEGEADATFQDIVAVPGAGDRFATGGTDGSIRLWRLERGATPKLTQTDLLRHHSGKIMALSVAPDGRWLLASSQDQTLSAWPLAALQPGVTIAPVVIDPPGEYAHDLAIHPREPLFASAGDIMQIWRVNRELLAQGQGAQRSVVAGSVAATAPRPMTAASWTGDDAIVTASADGSVRRWQVAAGALQEEVIRPGDGNAPSDQHRPVAVEGSVAAIGLADGQIAVVDTATGTTLEGRAPEGATLKTLALAGGCVIAGTTTSGLVLWKRGPDALTLTVSEPAGVGVVRLIEPSRSGTLVVVAGHQPNGEGDLVLFQLDPDACVTRGVTRIPIPNTPSGSAGSSVSYPGGGGRPPVTAAFSPDGRWLLTADGAGGGAILWRVNQTAPALEKVEYLLGHSAGAMAVAFSPDGTRAVTAGNHGETLLWRIDPGADPIAEKLEDLPPPAQPARFSYAAAFSPSGNRLAVPGGHHEDGRLWLFELAPK